MPEINTYTVKPRELVELIIKASGVHDGKWFLAATYGMAVTNVGPGPGELTPGAVIGLQSLAIQRDTPETPAPEGMAVDAAEVNPKAAGTRSKASST